MNNETNSRQQPPATAIPSLDLQQLRVISALGRGAKGLVLLVQTNGQLVALKTISKASIEMSHRKEDKPIPFEQQVLSCFHHPLLPTLRGVLTTHHFVGYAIDYCPGPNLHSLRTKQTEKMFSHHVIRFYAAELVLALEYVQGLGIVYRDLKPENVMIQENGHLMLVDFDLSTKLPSKPHTPMLKSSPKAAPKKKKSFRSFSFRRRNSGISPEDLKSCDELEWESVDKKNSFVGTEEYVAPEVIQGLGHEFAVDWWCLGVMLYEMLYGTTPFKGSNRKETFFRILTKSPDLVGEATPLRDLIRRLLEKDPKKRISVAEIKGHDFFAGTEWGLVLDVSRPPFIPVVGPPEDALEGNDVDAFVHRVFNSKCEGDNMVNDFAFF